MLSHHSFHNFARLSKSIKIPEEKNTFAGNTLSSHYPTVKPYL